MSDRISDSNWFPKPPPKPLKAASATPLVFGAIIAAVAVAGAAIWLTGDGRSGNKAKPAAAQSAVTTDAPAQGTRQAFADCMKSMGAGSGFRGRGRLGGGPSKNYRNAFNVCRSLVRPGQASPVAPPRARTMPAPVA